MITILKTLSGALVPASHIEKGVWIDVRVPHSNETAMLIDDYGILSEHIQDVLDPDEQSRIEKEDAYTMLIVRLPVFDPGFEISYFTVPVGIFLFPDKIVTLCRSNSDALERLLKRSRNLDTKNKSAFVLRLIGAAAIVYLNYLKEINRRTGVIERELQRSVKNNELIQLLTLEKCLVYFTTSLKSNGLLLDKIKSSRFIRFKEDETELFEDVVTDNTQAIEMSNIYSDILAGMMDAFASVISNNLNIVMKRLTTISIVLMIPTLIASLFGMNVDLPFTSGPFAFAAILGISSLGALIGAFLLRDRRKTVRGRKRPLPISGAMDASSAFAVPVGKGSGTIR